MKIHFTAIGGTGMGSMAGLMAAAGHEVRGSDLAELYPPMSTLLAELAIPVAAGYAAENLDWGPELVVIGNTCSSEHPELLEARRRGLRCASFPELLAEQLLSERHSIVIAGTHGKTTTTSLVAYLLHRAGCAPGYLVGGIPADFARSFALGEPPYFVVEGDEYDSATFDKRPKFVHYLAETAVLTGVEFDHADIYPSLDHVKRAFAKLIERLTAGSRLLVCADSPVAVELATASAGRVERYRALPVGAPEPAEAADWTGRFERLAAGRQRLTLVGAGGEVLAGPAEVPMSGAHNMANCVAALAVGVGLGLDAGELLASLECFGGVARRQQLRGVAAGVAVIDDFAHHPTAVATTLDGLRGVHGDGKLVAVLEPRSGSSRRNVFQEQFAEALTHADLAVVAPLFAPEKIPAAERLDRDQVVADVARLGTEAHGPADVDGIVDLLVERCTSGDTVVVMSSGSFDGLINKLLAALAASR